MFRNLHNPGGLSRHARNQTSRWRVIFIALMLALTIGSAGQTQPAQAAPGREALLDDIRYRYEMFTDKAPGLMCVGKKWDFRVAVLEQTFNLDKPSLEPPEERVTGLPVKASVEKKIGKISPPMQIIGFDLESDFVVFTFIATNPGKADVIFTIPKGRLEQEITRRVPVNVVRCKFKITTLGDWNIPGEAQGYVAAISKEAEVKAPDPQSPFTGSTSVNWVASVGRVRDCGGAATIGSSKLDWNGTLDEGGQLNLNGNFQTAAGTFDITCARGGESFDDSMPLELTPDPVSVSVDSSGGVINQSQTLEWEGANPGNITIVIVPAEETGVAVIPDNHEVSWDDFSSLFDALLVLH